MGRNCVKIILILSLLTLPLILISCEQSSGIFRTEKETPSTTSNMTTIINPVYTPPIYQGNILVEHVHVESSLIKFSGTAGLPEGTILHSQIYEDNVPLSWWPTTNDITVQNGQWTVSVSFGEQKTDGRISVGPQYIFDIWQEDYLDVRGEYSFDLVGPPKMQVWWKRIPSITKEFFQNIFKIVAKFFK
jgi:hypothetical protein